ncbi:NucA/NucB deoxyribonuclease domain-containing protein [Actinokineospora spheciospongiae]|uniref:NucA/NucB deoxyribonuclease domain-containing protein n=1 Tax=Actinokineospora spheciospongiae TaxID=909613 RepID=UPI00055741F1|nr:NucA/NucB deoxyribonuclease domain-containing protein [Actinokineospora spheciospongiae]PWW64759.1 deoxyribonuclease NucA/NucB [Actinokineospora spheciospongiae]
MSTKTKSGLLPILLAVGAVVAVTQTDIAQEVINSVDIEEKEADEVLVPPSFRGRVKECTPEQLTKDRRCKDLPVVPIDAEKMPYIARHISVAWSTGQPALLHYEVDLKARELKNRSVCTPARLAELKPKSCDEYPFKSAKEGGPGASTQGVPTIEQNRQGGAVGRAYTVNRLQDGDAFLVVIINPGQIATEEFEG